MIPKPTSPSQTTTENQTTPQTTTEYQITSHMTLRAKRLSKRLPKPNDSTSPEAKQSRGAKHLPELNYN